MLFTVNFKQSMTAIYIMTSKMCTFECVTKNKLKRIVLTKSKITSFIAELFSTFVFINCVCFFLCTLVYGVRLGIIIKY